MSASKNYNPNSLFNLCSKVVRENPCLERELLKCDPAMNFEYSHERMAKDIQKLVSRPYLLDNKSFERFFRKLVKENIRVSRDVKFMLRRVSYLEKKIDSFKNIYGVVLEVYFDVLHLQRTLEMLV